MSRSYTSSPPSASMACSGTALPFSTQHILALNVQHKARYKNHTQDENVLKKTLSNNIFARLYIR
jgi:hypothetical protein